MACALGWVVAALRALWSLPLLLLLGNMMRGWSRRVHKRQMRKNSCFMFCRQTLWIGWVAKFKVRAISRPPSVSEEAKSCYAEHNGACKVLDPKTVFGRWENFWKQNSLYSRPQSLAPHDNRTAEQKVTFADG